MLNLRLLLSFEIFSLLLNLALFSEAMEKSLEMNICAPLRYKTSDQKMRLFVSKQFLCN